MFTDWTQNHSARMLFWKNHIKSIEQAYQYAVINLFHKSYLRFLLDFRRHEPGRNGEYQTYPD
jgi:hypothetical protein